jgi:hypothetical protein
MIFYKILEYDQIFDDKNSFEINSVINKLPTKSSLELLADLINSLNKKNKTQIELLKIYFPGIKDTTIIKRLNANINKDFSMIFPILSCMKVVSKISQLKNTNDNPLTTENRIILLKVILFFNKTQRDNTLINIATSTESKFLRDCKLGFFNHLPFFDLLYPQSVKSHVYGQIIELYYLLIFLKKDSNSCFFKEYSKKYNYSIIDLFKCFFKIAVTHNEQQNLCYFIRNNNEAMSETEKYIFEKEVIIEDIENDYFKHLRIQPIIKINDNLYFIPFLSFALSKFYRTLFFELQEIYNKNKDKFPNIEDFRQYYTTEFSERTLFSSVLNELFSGDQYKAINGEELNKSDKSFSDYYVREGKKIFLFENKDNLFAEKIKQSTDSNEIESYLKSKFYDVGIKQLIENIKKIFEGKYNRVDSKIKLDKIRIYPVIVIHDYMFNLTGLNFIVNEWFNNEIDNLVKEKILSDKIRKRIKDVTLVFINDLIVNKTYFTSNQLKLDVLIDKYIERSYKHLSFSFFLEDYIKENGDLKITEDETLKEKIDYIVPK